MNTELKTADFDYQLPPELIAQVPTPDRDKSRLLVLHRDSGRIEHCLFSDLPAHLRPGDVLVINDTRVIPARLRAINPQTGGKLELLLLEPAEENRWWAMVRPARRARPECTLEILPRNALAPPLHIRIVKTGQNATRLIQFQTQQKVTELLPLYGEPPIPPYIERCKSGALPLDQDRYQTVYARVDGSVAAPTAGLHFTTELLKRISEMGVEICNVTLHVGYATFAPVKTEKVSEHQMHHEWYNLPEHTAATINKAKSESRRIIAVGTTSVRVLETAANAASGQLTAGSGKTNLFIYPPFEFRVVDALITNFHLPRSTLLMLVSAFASPGGTSGIDLIRKAYQEAIRLKYRFYSYGDAMLIL